MVVVFDDKLKESRLDVQLLMLTVHDKTKNGPTLYKNEGASMSIFPLFRNNSIENDPVHFLFYLFNQFYQMVYICLHCSRILGASFR